MDQSRYKVASVTGVLPVLVKLTGGLQSDTFAFVEPIKQEVFLPFGPHEDGLKEAILAWLNKQEAIDVKLPPEIYEAAGHSQDVKYSGDMPEVE